MVQVLLFAGLAETAGATKVEVDVSLPAKVSDVKRAFAEAYPQCAEQLATCFAAINQSYAHDASDVRPGDEIAFLPPVSGG